VKPDLFGSYTLANVSIEARFLFVGLFTEADDDGLLLDSPKRLAGAIFPHDEKVTAGKVNAWLDELQKVLAIMRFEVDDGQYIGIPAWMDHQRISHPTASKFRSASGMFRELLRGQSESFRPEGEGKGREGEWE